MEKLLQWKDIISLSVNGNLAPDKRVEKTAEEWRKILSQEQFDITRLKGTERAHSSDICTSYDAGIYTCICCDTELFDSSIKYDSKSGWPSFTQAIKPNAIKYEKDESFGIRIEIMCSTCDSHLGHVFPDGPEPSGLRYCVNAISIQLKA